MGNRPSGHIGLVLRRLEAERGAPRPFWTLRRSLFCAAVAGFGGGVIAVLWFAP